MKLVDKNKDKVIELLKQALEEIPRLRELRHDERDYELWHSRVNIVLEAAFGKESSEYKWFNPTTIIAIGKTDEQKQRLYLKRLQDKEIAIQKIFQKYNMLDMMNESSVISIPPESILQAVPPKAFIAHEGETRALTMLKEFLEALNVEYFIAESKASSGRSIEGQVDWTQAEADFAICLATKGKAINKKTGKHYMGLNVADELGRARQVFGNKIILLMQKGIEPHTNIREVVYESFTTTNMEKAFIKIAKELSGWGFIKAGKY